MLVKKKTLVEVLGTIKESNYELFKLLVEKISTKEMEDVSLLEVEIDYGNHFYNKGGWEKGLLENNQYLKLIKDFNFKFPLMLVIQGEFEIFLNIKRKSDFNGISNFPLAKSIKGDFLGSFEFLDNRLSQNGNVLPPWSIFSGGNTKYILPFQYTPFREAMKGKARGFLSKKRNGESFLEYSTTHSKLLYEILHDDIPAKIKCNVEYKSKVIIFSEECLLKLNSNEFDSFILKGAWKNTKYLRDAQVLNIELEKIKEKRPAINKDIWLFFQYIILAGNGMMPLFTRSDCKVDQVIEAHMSKLYSKHGFPAVFGLTWLNEESLLSDGFISLSAPFHSYKRPLEWESGRLTILDVIFELSELFSLLSSSDKSKENLFGYQSKFDIKFFVNSDQKQIEKNMHGAKFSLFHTSELKNNQHFWVDINDKSRGCIEFNKNVSFLQGIVKIERLQ